MRSRLLPSAAVAGALSFLALLAASADPQSGNAAAEPAAAESSAAESSAAERPAAERPAALLRVLVLPIVVHSAVPDASHVSGGLSDMLSARLEQTGRLFVERPEEAALATTRVAAALREGRMRGADFVIFGSFTQFGDGASLDIQCIPVRVASRVASEEEAAAARRIFIQSGAVGDIIPRLDEIADRLAACVNAGSPRVSGETVASDGAPAPPPAASAAPADAGALRDIAERLEALEEAVFGGGDTNAAAQFRQSPGES